MQLITLMRRKNIDNGKTVKIGLRSGHGRVRRGTTLLQWRTAKSAQSIQTRISAWTTIIKAKIKTHSYRLTSFAIELCPCKNERRYRTIWGILCVSSRSLTSTLASEFLHLNSAATKISYENTLSSVPRMPRKAKGVRRRP